MEIAAHTPGGYGGVPQSVGRDFAKADDKAGITKTHGSKPAGSPKSRDEHMARLVKHKPQKAVAKDFGRHPSTVSRGVMRQGYSRIGGA
jgi:hypothetical protein